MGPFAEQGTHKPWVGSSNLPLATEVNYDQQPRKTREVVGRFSVCDKGLRRRFVTNVLNYQDLELLIAAERQPEPEWGEIPF